VRREIESLLPFATSTTSCGLSDIAKYVSENLLADSEMHSLGLEAMRFLKSFLIGVWQYLLALAYWDISRCLEGLRHEIDVRKWVAVSGLLGGAWMVVLLSARSFRLAYLTNYPALWLTASVVSARDVRAASQYCPQISFRLICDSLGTLSSTPSRTPLAFDGNWATQKSFP
jgi:hypothetical protein